VENKTAEWGKKVFVVSPSKIIPLRGLSTSYTRKSDTNNDTSDVAASNTRGMEPQPISLKTTYVAGAGVNPREELESWKNLFDQRHPLYINGERFGPALLELESISADIVTDNAGRFLQVELDISFIEYASTVKSSAAKVGSSNASALSAKPTAVEKRTTKVALN
jgi:hypothetical protein